MSKMVCSDPACGWVGKEGETTAARVMGVGGSAMVCPRCQNAAVLRACDAEDCAQPARWSVESTNYGMTCREHVGAAREHCAPVPR